MRIRHLFIISGLILQGCVASSTGITPMGPDTYMMASNDPWLVKTGLQLKADLYQAADAWCRSQGLVMMPVSHRSLDSMSGNQAEIIFRALRPGDPEIQRVKLESAPDRVIEWRNR